MAVDYHDSPGMGGNIGINPLTGTGFSRGGEEEVFTSYAER
jgi:hypothetical protein